MAFDRNQTRRSALQTLLAGGACVALPTWAQNFPSRPITWVVPYAAGAASDLLTRRLAQEVGNHAGQAVVIDNVVGAGSTIAARRLAADKPDGHRIITLDVAALAIHPAVTENAGYDPNKSFTPISLGWRIPFVLVTSTAQGPQSLSEWVSRAKERPDTVTYGSAGIGSAIHLAMVLLEDQAGLRLTHVPYGGAAPALVDVLAGRVDAMFISLGAAAPHIKSGKLRVLGASGAKRFQAAPDVPTIEEQGFSGYEASSWQGALGPAGMPREISEPLNQWIVKALSSPSVRDTFRAAGAEPEPSTPQAFADYIRAESTKWARLIRAKGIRLN